MKPLTEELLSIIYGYPRWIDEVEHLDGDPNNNDLDNLRTVRVLVPQIDSKKPARSNEGI